MGKQPPFDEPLFFPSCIGRYTFVYILNPAIVLFSLYYKKTAFPNETLPYDTNFLGLSLNLDYIRNWSMLRQICDILHLLV